MRNYEIASNAKYRKDRWGSKFRTTKCKISNISEFQNFPNCKILKID